MKRLGMPPPRVCCLKPNDPAQQPPGHAELWVTDHECPGGLLQRLDTHHGLFATGTLVLPAARRPFLGDHDEILQPAAPILLPRRSARQDPYPLPPRCQRYHLLAPTHRCQPRRLSPRHRPPSATDSSSPASACSPGTGSPTSATRKKSPSSSATPCT